MGFQFRWFEIKGIYIAFPISITLFYNPLKFVLAAFNLLNKDGDTLSTKELSAIFGFGNEKEAAVMERFLKISIRKELHIEGDVNITFDEFYELIGGDRESGLQGIALAFEVNLIFVPIIGSLSVFFLSEFR